MSTFPLDRHLLETLTRIATKRGSGHPNNQQQDLVALILSLTPGAVVDVDDVRTVQSAMFWHGGFGGDAPFEAYLEQVPLAPGPDAQGRLTLVDPRLGDAVSCERFGIVFGKYGHDDETFMALDQRHDLPRDRVYWVLIRTGEFDMLDRIGLEMWGRDRAVLAAVREGRRLEPDQYFGTSAVGLANWIQHGPGEYIHTNILPGSVRRDEPECCAGIGIWDYGPTLRASCRPEDRDTKGYGVLTFRLC
mgnify:FL=1